jgi:hypothetical protein
VLSTALTLPIAGAAAHGRCVAVGHAFQPEVIVVVTSAFHDVFAELADRDEIVGLGAVRRIIELAAHGERRLPVSFQTLQAPQSFEALVDRRAQSPFKIQLGGQGIFCTEVALGQFKVVSELSACR